MEVIFFHPLDHRWRLKLRKALSSAQKVTPKAADGDQEAKGNEDDQLLNEMEELTNVLDRKKRRAKKLIAKRRAKVSLY